MTRLTKNWILLALGALLEFTFASAEVRIRDTLWLPNGLPEPYLLVIPDDYNPLQPPPLLIGCHSYGADLNEFAGSAFDEEADTLGWMSLSISGVPSTERGYVHWWSKRVQRQLDLVLDTVMQQYPFDVDNLFIVGGSMGGAAGMQYNNNHLDPNGYMVRATAGGSGIIDLARRKREQGSNVSMMWEFGGIVDSVSDYVNFEYKRNSGVVFWDTTNSLHYNMMWMPLYQASGVLEPHYTHDTDLVNLYGREMISYRVDGRAGASHGWVNLIPDTTMSWFLEQPRLHRHPTLQNVAADEPRRCYDIEFIELNSDTNMARAIMIADSFQSSAVEWELRNHRLTIVRNVRSVRLYINNELESHSIAITNQQQERVSVLLAFPNLVGAPGNVTVNPNLQYRYSEVTRELELLSVPAGFTCTIQASQWSGMPDPETLLPDNYSMSVYPNPFNAMANVRIFSARAGATNLAMYDVSGRVVRKLPRRFLRAPGSVTFSLPAQQLPSGSYFLSGSVSGAPITTRVTILR